MGTLTLAARARECQVSVGADYENNDVNLFQKRRHGHTWKALTIDQTRQLAKLAATPAAARARRREQRVAERVVFTWDRRDTPFNAHSGTYVALGVEQVNSYPVAGTAGSDATQFESHFLRLTQTFAGYIPITSTIVPRDGAAPRRDRQTSVSVPGALRARHARHAAYCTYPDRLFFMGGFDSMRGWLQDAFIPQDTATRSGPTRAASSARARATAPSRSAAAT